MAKAKVSEWDVVSDNNIVINGININENCPPSAVNNAIREMMAQIKQWQSGSSGDDWTSSGVFNITGILKLDGSAGTDGQVLSSKGSSATPIWKTLGTMSAQNYNNVNITGGSVNVTGSLKLDGSVGSNGQVLKSVGSTATPIWTTLGTMSLQNRSSVNITGGSVNVSGSFKLDNSTGTAGQVMVSKGSSDTPVWGDAFIRGMIMLWTGSVAPSGWTLCNGVPVSGVTPPDLRDKFVMGKGGSQPASGGYPDATLVSHNHTGTTNNGGAKTIPTTVSLSGSTGNGGAKTLTSATSVSGSTASAGSHAHNGINLPWTEDDNPDGQNHSVITNNYGGPIATIRNSSTTAGGEHAHSFSASGTTSVVLPNHTHSLAGVTGSGSVVLPNHTHGFTTADRGSSATNKNLPPYYALAYIMKL